MLIFCASSVLAPVLITLITLQVALVLESPVPVLKQYAFVCPFQDGQFHNLSFLSQIVVNCAFLCANFLVNMLLPTVLGLFSLLFATMFDKSNFCHFQKSSEFFELVTFTFENPIVANKIFCQAGLVGILSEMAGA